MAGNWGRENVLIACVNAWCMFATTDKANGESRQMFDACNMLVQELCELGRCLNRRDQHVTIVCSISGGVLRPPVSADDDSKCLKSWQSGPKLALCKRW